MVSMRGLSIGRRMSGNLRFAEQSHPKNVQVGAASAAAEGATKGGSHALVSLLDPHPRPFPALFQHQSPLALPRKTRNTRAQNKPTNSATNSTQNPLGAIKTPIPPQNPHVFFDETNPPRPSLRTIFPDA